MRLTPLTPTMPAQSEGFAFVLQRSDLGANGGAGGNLGYGGIAACIGRARAMRAGRCRDEQTGCPDLTVVLAGEQRQTYRQKDSRQPQTDRDSPQTLAWLVCSCVCMYVHKYVCVCV